MCDSNENIDGQVVNVLGSVSGAKVPFWGVKKYSCTQIIKPNPPNEKLGSVIFFRYFKMPPTT